MWMKTAVEKDQGSGRGQQDVETDTNELNVAHVCTGLAFELALKALAISEGRPITKKHEAEKNFRNLGKKSQTRIKQFVETNTPQTIERLLEYLDERMCHPDRKYWMVGRRGEHRAVGFVHSVPGLVIPDLATVHAEIVQMAGENTFDGLRQAARVRSRRGEHLATARFAANGSIRWEVTKAGKELGVTTSPAPRRINIVCPRCGSLEWQREKEEPDPDDQVTCKRCRINMRAGDVVSWNKERAKGQ